MNKLVRKASARTMSFTLQRLPPEGRRRVGALIAKTRNQTYLGKLSRWYSEFRNVDAFLISFPKCGRTWLRLMTGRVFVNHFELQDADILEKTLKLEPLSNLNPVVPRIRATHDDSPLWKKPDELAEEKLQFKDSKVIFLARDPRDVIISLYFEKKKRVETWIKSKSPAAAHFDPERMKPYEGDLSDYLHEEVGGFDTLLRYYNIWAKNRNVPKDFLLVRYEDIKKDPKAELMRLLSFLEVGPVEEGILDEAIRFASFDSMRKMEVQNAFNNFSLSNSDRGDESSFKTRKGKVGGFREYLSPDEIALLNQKMAEGLSGFYGYTL